MKISLIICDDGMNHLLLSRLSLSATPTRADALTACLVLEPQATTRKSGATAP